MRDLIRQAIIDRLALVLPTNVSVYNNRFAAVKNLPAVIVYSLGDSAEKSADEQSYTRRENITINCYVSGLEEHEEPTEFIAPRLDNLISIVESEFLHPYENLSRLIYRLNYQSTDIQYREDGDRVYAMAVISFEAIYFHEMDKING